MEDILHTAVEAGLSYVDLLYADAGLGDNFGSMLPPYRDRLMLLGLVLALLATAWTATPTLVAQPQGTDITVDTFDDELNDGGGDCSLREAIQAANTDSAVDACPAGSGDDTITLPAGTYTLTLPGAEEDGNATGDLDITDDLSINGTGAGGTVVDGNQLDRVLHIHGGATVEIRDVAIATGRTSDGSAGSDGGDGGGICNAGVLTLERSSVSENTTGVGGGPNGDYHCGDGGSGGGIYNAGTLVVSYSTITGNTTGDGGGSYYAGDGGYGGGIYNSGRLTLTNSIVVSNATGNGGSSGCCGGDGGFGGGIYNSGKLTATHSTIRGNTTGRGGSGHAGYAGSGGDGGGIYNADTLAVTHSTVVSNATGGGGGGDYGDGGGYGGGICNRGTLTVTNSTLASNVTGDGAYSHFGPYLNFGGPGGGMHNGGTLIVTHSTIHSNTTGDGGTDPYNEGSSGGPGGGIYNSGVLTASNTTVSRNATGHASGDDRGHDGYGGGICSYRPLALYNSTISDNSAGDVGGTGKGGGIYIDDALNVKNTVIAGNSDLSGYGDCYQSDGTVHSLGYNLVEIVGTCTFTATSDITNTNPLLGPLADNGGDTLTYALLPGSPAADQGSCGGAITDQRGRPRPIDIPAIANADDGCDIGAYEYQGFVLSLAKAVDDLLPDPGQRITYTVAIGNVGDFTTTQALISDTPPSGVTLAGPVTLDPPEAGTPGTPPILASGLTIAPRQRITLTFPVTVNTSLVPGTVITNTAAITSAEVPRPQTGSVAVTVRHCLYLPLILRDCSPRPTSLRSTTMTPRAR